MFGSSSIITNFANKLHLLVDSIVGTVLLDERSVKDSISHGIGRRKAAAFAAVPDIIREGAIIDRQENWKGRGYGSVTFAAPVEIGGEGYVGVVIAKEVTRSDGTHRFYLHEVALQKSLRSEEFKTGIDTGSKQGDVAKVLQEIANAKDEGENLRFQFLGEQGAGRLDEAEERTERLDALSVARKMEQAGRDAAAVKLATGWERGADGKWRYEVPDAEYVNMDDAERAYKYVEIEKALSDKDKRTLKRYASMEWEDMSDKQKENYRSFLKRTGLDIGGNRAGDTYLPPRDLHLDDVLAGDKAEQLFKAYPQLRDVKVVYATMDSMLGLYNREQNKIFINSMLVKSAEKRSVLLHEVQHAIQSIEGFAPGGNKESVLSRMYAERKDTRSKEFLDLQDREEQLRRKWSDFRERIKKLSEETGEDYVQLTLKDPEYAELEAEGARIREEYRHTNMEMSPYDAYRSLGGEVEARNVQKRLGMSAEERRRTLAAETEDVAREDQIFLRGEEGASESRAEEKRREEEELREV